ncbi:MFS transporter [Acidisphaera rubrifaciens]|uniref:Sugar transporter n=1 Tax=Acidisphaera rubrifaciens HS-AP3 TaxID=1231350 RepID=A0A0D6P3B9_9PROT|nr:MFS transporter [Acidisphaera rubrifaciens]GAN76255.1 sugar transporter [Acidisphaera rubrifaciens HS-AP3]
MNDRLKAQRHVVAACYLGWTLDAFDFFILIFVLKQVAASFHTTLTPITWAIFLTLLLRVIGSVIFGRLADRYGRRPTLMANVLIYAALEFATGFAPTLTVFLILRGLYGIAMGGEWGVGASLTMESIPDSWRGPVSGILQAGYPSGYLLASLLNYAEPLLGWRGMFMVGAAPALLVLYIRSSVPESPDWTARTEAERRAPILDVLRRHLPLTIYAVAMMTAFNFFSHGTQDLYPSAFLAGQHGFDPATVSTIAVVYNVGAILGGLFFGTLSQRIGRRMAIVIAALLSLAAIPLWAFAGAPVWIGLGAFLMQFCVQGAWGVVPAHLNELSPAEVRGTFPGLVYQLGNFIASGNATIQASIGAHMGHDYRWALAGVAGAAGLVIAVVVGSGREARHVTMRRADEGPAA